MLYHGWGSDPDGCRLLSNAQRAAPWLEKAAEMGVPRAQYLIGNMYRTGDGVPLSPEEAFKWLAKAANAGLSEAQFDLGLLLAGVGNQDEAYFWFFLLAESGYPGARQNADVVARNMEPGEIYQAERRAYYWSLTEP
jgi:TPR repeat protein